MRMTVELFRSEEGRLEGTVATGSGDAVPFGSTLDLLRVLEALDLGPAERPDGPPARGVDGATS